MEHKTTKGLLALLVLSGLGGCLSSGSDDEVAGPEGPTDVARPPSISGTPPPEVIVGSSYQFLPSASDPNGDTLTFAISNRPGWSQFDTNSGRLSGTPGAADVGVYDEIMISVSDGTSSIALDRFAISVVVLGTGSVSLSWIAPTENEDGSTLTDLSGFNIYYGTRTGEYTSRITIDDPSISNYLISDLAPDTYFFVATARNSLGIESDFSAEAEARVTAN